ncbi:hypothetical protein ACA910_014584 [Epithemia clementina (nom. ined.)]
MLKDAVGDEETQHELEVAVCHAIRWFETRRHPYNDDDYDEMTSDRTTQRRLYLDFRHLVISHGIDVEALSTRIRAKVPSDVPIHLSLQCCRMEDGGLEVMDKFLRNLPNVTDINVTLLWFDYCEISNVVKAASDLKKLELPLAGNQTGVSQVLRACSLGQLENLRFHSSGSSIETNVIQEVMAELSSLRSLKALSFISFTCTDDCFKELCLGLLNLENTLEKVHLSCEGNIGSASLPYLSQLIREMPAETQLSIRIRNAPELFQNASLDQIQDFMMSVKTQRSIKWLELDHVGLTSSSSARLFRALESPKKAAPSPSAVVSICGPFLLRGKLAFRQLIKSLPRMLALDCLAVIDTQCNLSQVVTGSKRNSDAKDNHDALVSAAIHRNPELQHLSLRIGEDAVYPPIMDHVFERNASLANARNTVKNAFLEGKKFPIALWPQAIASIAAQGGRFGADPVYLLLEHLFAT